MNKHLTLHLDIYAENYKNVYKYYGKKPAAALKNNAYGLGLLSIAPVFQELGCEYYFVYNMEEAINLRRLLGAKPHIITLSSIEKDHLAAYDVYNIIPTVESLYILNLYRNNFLSHREFVVYFDTGLQGKGIDWQESALAYEELKDLPVKIILSHLSSAWKIDTDMNQLQLQRFNHIRRIFGNNIMYSLSNTDGSRLGDTYRLDLPRVGRGLHGLSYYHKELGIKKAFSVKARITQVKRGTKNTAVGYGAYKIIEEDTNLGVVNIGNAVINTVNFPFMHQVIWQNTLYEVLFVFLGYMVVDFKNDLPSYEDEVELVFESRFNPNILR